MKTKKETHRVFVSIQGASIETYEFKTKKAADDFERAIRRQLKKAQLEFATARLLDDLDVD